LQSIFATRFNRFRGERGHVFQRRYESILVEEDRPLLGLIDYILIPFLGLCVDDLDLVIAATAVWNNLTLATLNVRRFALIEGLRRENWSS